MLWVVIGFLVFSLLLYCVLGGADFGAGALEIFVSKKNLKRHEELVNQAMGPVWEANHIWLIILIVILFNAFPSVYAQYSIYFHVPLTLMLVGIVLRGCGFAFRNYDAVKDDSHGHYSRVFSIASLLTPVMFGMIMGGMFVGVDAGAPGFYQKYMAPWFNWYSLSVGIFVLCLFVYLASVYLIGEASGKEMKAYYIHCTRQTSRAMFLSGALVFLLAQWTRHPMAIIFFTNPVSISCFTGVVTIALLFWRWIEKNEFTEWGLRLAAGTQAGLVLLAWLAMIFPNVLFFSDGHGLSLLDAAAHPSAIDVLGWSLIIGAMFFLPILYCLIRTFKGIQD